MRTFVLLIISLLIGAEIMGQDYRILRQRMVESQLAGRGISDQHTLEAMRKVERHRFVPEAQRRRAYEDTPLPIWHGQTISQPYMVALMTELLAPRSGQRVLEIGAGSGYQAAVLAEIVDSVYTIEIVSALAERTRELMRDLGYANIQVITGDGYAGLPDKAPFDAIIVTAAPEEIPQPLLDQLKEGGKMIIPIGKQTDIQDLILIEKKNGQFTQKSVSQVRFVPFTRQLR